MVDNSDFLDPEGSPGYPRDLRDRIAAVLQAQPPVCLQSQSEWLDWTENRADAVIAELHLEVTFHYTTSLGTEVCLKGYYSVGGQ